jgi:hypothetical protein
VTSPHFDDPASKPPQPHFEDAVYYRGWEAAYDDTAARCGVRDCFRAYKGGVDLDASEVSAETWTELLLAIDEEEDEE